MTPDGKFIVKIPLGRRGLKPFEQFVVCTKTVFWTLNHLVSNESIDPNDPQSWNVFIKNLNFFSTEERKTWTSWMTWG